MYVSKKLLDDSLTGRDFKMWFSRKSMFDFAHFFCKFVLINIREQYLTYANGHVFIQVAYWQQMQNNKTLPQKN